MRQFTRTDNLCSDSWLENRWMSTIIPNARKLISKAQFFPKCNRMNILFWFLSGENGWTVSDSARKDRKHCKLTRLFVESLINQPFLVSPIFLLQSLSKNSVYWLSMALKRKQTNFHCAFLRDIWVFLSLVLIIY